ncbi:MAG: lipopolysaccharide kinase InaA family protein, partial [Longimicrobiales bacterium]
RTAFAAGVEHADLNLRNILITGGARAPRAMLLDLDRAVVHDHAVSNAARSAMLARLHRSRLKLERRAGQYATEAELAALVAGLGAAND